MNEKQTENKPAGDNKFLWDQFAKLGEMMGDGLHHEPDGKWINKEYKALARILIPDFDKELRERSSRLRKAKAERVNEQMARLLAEKKCTKDGCGGDLKQKRAGTKICYCIKCNSRYKAR